MHFGRISIMSVFYFVSGKYKINSNPEVHQAINGLAHLTNSELLEKGLLGTCISRLAKLSYVFQKIGSIN